MMTKRSRETVLSSSRETAMHAAVTGASRGASDCIAVSRDDDEAVSRDRMSSSRETAMHAAVTGASRGASVTGRFDPEAPEGETKDFDFEFFAQLLEKALEEGKKKKARSNQPRKTNTKPRRKQKDKAAAEQSLHDEESAISEEEGADAGTAEKENKRSLDVDECSGATDPVKKKKPKRKKDGTKKPEEENNRESQDDDLTPMPKKEKSSKTKDLTLDTGNKPELHSVDDDGNLKGTLAEKKTRIQKKKPNYKETELEDENDGDFAITENSEADDPHVSCNDGEDDLSSQSPALTCEEETSLLLFTVESDYQSGLDLSGYIKQH
ncbi:unnamed protein product [Ranitomeya imitator]|uniref:Uncharacterized protein n=1 Tax=Ranitomeya imitator TaxID=111125 RepID=A0ABN9MDT8_9NEOB|nr:unnamed protein product [Ranitomeya imitator]